MPSVGSQSGAEAAELPWDGLGMVNSGEFLGIQSCPSCCGVLEQNLSPSFSSSSASLRCSPQDGNLPSQSSLPQSSQFSLPNLPFPNLSNLPQSFQSFLPTLPSLPGSIPAPCEGVGMCSLIPSSVCDSGVAAVPSSVGTRTSACPGVCHKPLHALG